MVRWVAILTTAVAASAVRAAVVYDNTTTRTGMVNALLPNGQTDSPEHGNQINLGGAERAVTGMSFYLRILGAGPATFEYRIRFYANDGPAGRPGTLLWDSGPRPAIIDSGADLLYTLSVPWVIVPHSLTWTVQLTNRQMNLSLMGPSEYHPPTVGSAPFGFWRRTGPAPEQWEYVSLNEPPFGARLLADALPGDLDGDGDVDLSDFIIFQQCFGGSNNPPAPTCPPGIDADLDGDGDVDLADFLIFQQNFTGSL